jgi:hypothetical protein
MPGAHLSTELYRQAGHLSLIQQHDQFPGGARPLDDSIDRCTALAVRNRAGTAAVLSGDGADGVLGSGYRRADTVLPLLTRTWPPNADGSANPLDQMFTSLTGRRDAIAGAAVGGLAEILADTANPVDADPAGLRATGHALLAGGNNLTQLMTLGHTNPHLLRRVAGALAPYVAGLAGADGGQAGTEGFGPLGPLSATRVFTVLDSDHTAGGILNGAALAQARTFDRAALDRPDSMAGTYAGRLRGLVDAGINSQLESRNLEAAARHEAAARTWRAAYAMAELVVNRGLESVPGAQYIPITGGPVEGVGEDTVVRFFTGPAPEDSYALPANSAGIRDLTTYDLLERQVQAGRIDPRALPPQLRDDHGLRPFADLARQGGADGAESGFDALKNEGSNALLRSGIDPERVSRSAIDAYTDLRNRLDPEQGDDDRRRAVYRDDILGRGPAGIDSWDQVGGR